MLVLIEGFTWTQTTQLHVLGQSQAGGFATMDQMMPGQAAVTGLHMLSIGEWALVEVNVMNEYHNCLVP